MIKENALFVSFMSVKTLDYKYCEFLSLIDVVSAQYKEREFAGVYLYNWSKRNKCKVYIENLNHTIYYKSAHFRYHSLVKTMPKSEILD